LIVIRTGNHPPRRRAQIARQIASIRSRFNAIDEGTRRQLCHADAIKAIPRPGRQAYAMPVYQIALAVRDRFVQGRALEAARDKGKE
jgi:hypothetical protein